MEVETMRYEKPEMLISIFDSADDILTASTVAEFGDTFEDASSAASGDIDSADLKYSIDVKTFN